MENRQRDPTVFWVPNAACVRAMLEHVGYVGIEGGQTPASAVFRAETPHRSPGAAPDQTTAPWN